MANKTATLKNQAGDNIYPNIVGDNRNAAIKDSTTIKHTLAENKISLDLDETVKGKIDAALQKPTGLTKTKLVGVGANGQENIEIGDNLTLANGKLSASGGGSNIPVVEGTVTGQTAESVTITIPEAQSSNYVLNLLDTYYVYMDTIGTSGLGGGVFVAEPSPGTIMMQITSYVGQGTNITKYESIYTLSTLFNDYKIFIEGQESYDILPYDADTDTDEGKVLTVRNGDLVWETPSASGGVSVTFED